MNSNDERKYGAVSALWQTAGQALLDYCFILLLIVVVVILMIYAFGQSTNKTWSGINSTVTSAVEKSP